MEAGNLKTKFKLLFAKLEEPNYILNNHYVDDLLNKLRSNNGDIPNTTNILTDLILSSLHNLDSKHVTVRVFIIRLLAIIVKDEMQFIKIFTIKVDEITAAFQKIVEPGTSPSTKVALLELALAMVCHTSGTECLYQKHIWKSIVNLCFSEQTVFVSRKSYNFLADFLWKLSDNECEEYLVVVLECILAPILNNPYLGLESLSKEEDYEKSKLIEPSLYILEKALSYKEKYQRPSILIKLIAEQYKIKIRLISILSITHRHEIIPLITKNAFSIIFAKLFLQKLAGKESFLPSDFMELTVVYFNTLRVFIKKGLIIPMMDFCNVTCIIWSEVWGDKGGPVIEGHGKKVYLHNQLLLLHLVPILVYIKSSCKANMNDCSGDPLHQYVIKLLTTSCEHTTRTAYSIRNLMYDKGCVETAMHCVKRLSCLNNHLNDTGANIIFQALFYVLSNYVPLNENNEIVQDDDFEASSEKIVVMTYVIDTIYRLVANFDINWQESLETVCLYNKVHYILKRRNLSCKFIVAALNLIITMVKKFLPPSLSLLVASEPGSPINELGKLIYDKLHDPHWEIRDSALELLLVCTDISFVKYTPFQKQIIDNNLIVVAATIGLNDGESYVQASAVKCLGAASKVSTIWDQLVKQYPDILEKLIGLLYNNPEGIVRKEVAQVLCEVYKNIKLSASYKTQLYEHMVSAAITDFHWEVQLTALEFWRIVVKSLFEDQGMLDGTFPSVTFSKETRKIVTLNEAEVQKRLKRALEDLANIGYLTVLVKLLDDDIDVDIMDISLKLANDLLVILDKYNVDDMSDVKGRNGITTDDLSEVQPEEVDSKDFSIQPSESTPKSDTIIDGILNVNDINLLSNIYERHMKLQAESPSEHANLPKVKLQKYASPALFVRHLKSKNFSALLVEKRKWKEGIRSMSSLLDDILGIYECASDINGMDCY